MESMDEAEKKWPGKDLNWSSTKGWVPCKLVRPIHKRTTKDIENEIQHLEHEIHQLHKIDITDPAIVYDINRIERLKQELEWRKIQKENR